MLSGSSTRLNCNCRDETSESIVLRRKTERRSDVTTTRLMQLLSVMMEREAEWRKFALRTLNSKVFPLVGKVDSHVGTVVFCCCKIWSKHKHDTREACLPTF